jgi:hypothetical protein
MRGPRLSRAETKNVRPQLADCVALPAADSLLEAPAVTVPDWLAGPAFALWDACHGEDRTTRKALDKVWHSAAERAR